MPFKAGRRETKVEIVLNVTRNEYYEFFIDFHFRSDVPSERERVMQIVGKGSYDKNGKPVKDGLAVPVKLEITSLDQTRPEPLNSTPQDEILEGVTRDYGMRRIYGLTLQPGRYRVSIEALEDIPGLEGIPITFDAHVPGRK